MGDQESFLGRCQHPFLEMLLPAVRSRGAAKKEFGVGSIKPDDILNRQIRPDFVDNQIGRGGCLS